MGIFLIWMEGVIIINSLILELPEIGIIKNYLIKIAMLGDRIGAPIANSDKDLAENLETLSYNLFCYNKQNKKTFTVCGDRKIKEMRILEDDDGFSESDTFYINSFIHTNLLDVFSELVSTSYLCPKTKKKKDSHLFVAELYSRYSGKKHAIFFVNVDDHVYVFNESLTEISLEEYTSDYFSASDEVDDNIKEICKISISKEPFAQKQRKIFAEAEKFNSSIGNKHSFIFGAITFLDFLGWKGLWQSQNEHDSLKTVSDLIEDFRKKLDNLSQEYFSEAKEIPLSSLISISDTIAVFTPKTCKADIAHLLKIHADFSRYVLEKCCENMFAIRGAVTYGEYSTIKNIMIGPGIDECASWHESGNWIGVHLAPSAQLAWDNSEESNILQYDHIPLKNGHKLKYCVRWGISKDSFRRLALRNRALLPEVAAKYINTLKFLEDTFWEGGVEDATE